MWAVSTFRSFSQHLWLGFAAGNLFATPDRALATIMRERAEHIDAARRYWACPF